MNTRDHTDASRNKLVEENLPEAMKSVRFYLRRWGVRMGDDEVMSVAGEALMRCVETYNPDRYKTFKGYVHLRVRSFTLKRAKEVAPRSAGPASMRMAEEPPPGRRAEVNDEVAKFMAGVPRARDRRILWMRAEGATLQEIADAVDLTKARVGQIVKERGM